MYKASVVKSRPIVAPQLIFEINGISFLYSYIRKNASTSFKLLFKELYPNRCDGDIPKLGCMINEIGSHGMSPEQIDQSVPFKIFVYRDPVDRVFSVYKNKIIQRKSAADFLDNLESILGCDPSNLTFEDFVRDYVSLIGTIDYGRVDAHLFPQTWHLLPITYNKVIALEDVYFEMLNLLPKGICDQVFKNPSNSTNEDCLNLRWADPDCPAIFFQKKYSKSRCLPSIDQVITDSTVNLLCEIYAEDFNMIRTVDADNGRLLSSVDQAYTFQSEYNDGEASKFCSGFDFSVPGAKNG